MKTLTLLVCVCALSACFSVSEGQRKPWKIHHKKSSVRRPPLHHRVPFHPKLQPNRNTLIQKHYDSHRYQRPLRPNRRHPRPKLPWLHKCPVKSNTVVNSNISKTTTQITTLSPTSTTNKIVQFPSMTSFIQNTTTISENINTGSSAVTPSPQPSPVLQETTTTPPTSSPTPPETTTAPSTSSPTLPETTATPPTSSLTTPVPQPSSTPLEVTPLPNTTPNPSPTTLAPETSQTTIAPTTQTTTSATTQTTTVGQTTSSFSKIENYPLLKNIYEILKYIFGVTSKK